jgi:uncharacterized protein (DUF362 family)
MNVSSSLFQENHVFVARARRADYGLLAGCDFPELPSGAAVTVATAAVRDLLLGAGLDAARIGTASWNPLADLIAPGSTVLLKPNWVFHANGSGLGLDCLITHSAVIEAVLLYVLRALPGRVVLADAPVQGCDWSALVDAAGISKVVERQGGVAERQGTCFSLADLRLVKRAAGGRIDCESGAVRAEDYVLFDLAQRSALEPVTGPGTRFRVTMYDPAALERTHAPGRHQYLIAREALDADVVINLPKLKTHKKSGVTGALKNIVGINGHKAYLPHHRKGGSGQGGDCYEGRSALKGMAEEVLDVANRTASPRLRRILPLASYAAVRVARSLGQDTNLEGSWHGNDTVWRMCLDLQRALRFGRPDGTLAGVPQRAVLSITDAIVAGEGEGPLSPTPVPLRRLTMGMSTAAVDWVNALLMGFDPARIPLIRHAFDADALPLVEFAPWDVEVRVGAEMLAQEALPAEHPRAFCPPMGWAGMCELGSPGTGL